MQGNPIRLIDPFGLAPNGMVSAIGHGILNVLGLIPGKVGIIADLVNAVWYALEGNWGMSVSCIISAIPGVTNYGANKFCVKSGKMTKTGKMIGLSGGMVGNAATFIRSGYVTVNMTQYMWEKCTCKNNDKCSSKGKYPIFNGWHSISTTNKATIT